MTDIVPWVALSGEELTEMAEVHQPDSPSSSGLRMLSEIEFGRLFATARITAPRIAAERVAAAQMEWERWKRANGVAAAGLRTSAADLRKLTKRQDESRDERDLERMAATLEELAAHLDGENWLRSPQAMAELRDTEASHG